MLWTHHPHTRNRLCAVSLAMVVVLFTIIVQGDSLPNKNAGPSMICPTVVVAGTNLIGSATDPNPPVTVTARANGTDLPGSPDTTQTDNTNSFSFQVDASLVGSTIVVTGTDGKGNTTTCYVEVVAA